MAANDFKSFQPKVQANHTTICDRLTLLRNVNPIKFLINNNKIVYNDVKVIDDNVIYIEINKELLCTKSSVFKTMMDDCKDNTIDLTKSNINTLAFINMIRYIVYGYDCGCDKQHGPIGGLSEYLHMYGLCYKYDIDVKVLGNHIQHLLTTVTTEKPVTVDTFIELYLSLPDDKIYQDIRKQMFESIKDMYVAMIYIKMVGTARVEKDSICKRGNVCLRVNEWYTMEQYLQHRKLFEMLSEIDKAALQKHLLYMHIYSKTK